MIINLFSIVKQRLTKYPMFLSEISRKTLPSHPDYESLIQSHKLIKDIVDLINERTRVVEKIDRLTVLQSKLIDFEFVSMSGIITVISIIMHHIILKAKRICETIPSVTQFRKRF